MGLSTCLFSDVIACPVISMSVPHAKSQLWGLHWHGAFLSFLANMSQVLLGMVIAFCYL